MVATSVDHCTRTQHDELSADDALWLSIRASEHSVHGLYSRMMSLRRPLAWQHTMHDRSGRTIDNILLRVAVRTNII